MLLYARGSSVKSINWPSKILLTSPFFNAGRSGAMTTNLEAGDSAVKEIGPLMAADVKGST